jgi:hypothetical protein
MASHDPASSLPIYYGEMTSHGTVVKRYDGESIDRPLTPLQRNLATPLREKPTSMPPEEPSSSKLPPEKRQRWSADDFRRGHGDDYWLPGPGSYWERKRWERDTDRGRDWYPEYRRPEQYIEYDGPPGMMRTSGSRREGEIKQVYRRRRGSWDGAPPPPPGPRRRNPYSDDEYEEEYYPKERRGPRKRAAGGGGREPPPKDDDSDKSGPKRLPYTKWMGMQAKNRKLYFVSIALTADLPL